jgi:putative GTP pyrophosphokinase
MDLVRMDDVAGCRVIFPDIKSLYTFREGLHKARFKHKLRNDLDKWDYIKHPKATGYRGVHDVFEYDVNSEYGAKYKRTSSGTAISDNRAARMGNLR